MLGGFRSAKKGVMTMSNETGWSTRNEVAYIDGMVSKKWSQAVVIQLASRKELLDNYIRSAKKRRDWGTFGDVDAGQVIGYAKTLRQKLVRDWADCPG